MVNLITKLAIKVSIIKDTMNETNKTINEINKTILMTKVVNKDQIDVTFYN